MTASELKALILAKPDGSPIRLAYGDGADTTVATLLNAEKHLGPSMPMRISAFATFLAGRGKLRAVCTAQDNGQLPDAIRDISYLISKLIDGAADREIDPNDSGTVTMMNALVSASVVSSADKDAWLEACRRPLVFSADDIANTRKA